MAAAAVLLALAAASSLTVSSCRGNSGGTDTFIPAVPDWSDASAWYISQPSGDNAPAADIFYILPTCIWDWTAADGQTCRYSDYTRTDHIEAFLPSVELAEDIFAQGLPLLPADLPQRLDGRRGGGRGAFPPVDGRRQSGI